jgi:hypothetical protein
MICKKSRFLFTQKKPTFYSWFLGFIDDPREGIRAGAGTLCGAGNYFKSIIINSGFVLEYFTKIESPTSNL